MQQRTSLPVVTARTEFGYARRTCGCATCSESCRFIPGHLVPQDLARLAPAGADEAGILKWAKQNLLASPGAVVGRTGPDGKITDHCRIPTLVPVRATDGLTCHWFGDDGACAVHANAPYGCAFFDSHMLDEGDGGGKGEDGPKRRSLRGLQEIVADWNAGGLYRRIWEHLFRHGLGAPSPEESRAEMKRQTGGSYARYGALRPTAAMTESVTEIFTAPPQLRPAGHTADVAGAGRNQPCPCGSGLKYKRCHGGN